jgi:hypothetical protein
MNKIFFWIAVETCLLEKQVETGISIYTNLLIFCSIGHAIRLLAGNSMSAARSMLGEVPEG